MDGSGRVDLSDIPWEDVPKYRLTPEALRVVRYFHMTESFTFYYLKGLMATRAAQQEPDFAPFLCAWAYEEEFHGRAFLRFMEAYGETVRDDYRGLAFSTRTIGERFDEAAQTAVSMAFPDAWPATHMVWGAIQECTTYNAYKQLIDRTGHPILKTICERIMKQELKHFAFYFQQARKRFSDSKLAQKLARGALTLAWTPVGDGMSPKAEVFHALRFLFDGRDGDGVGLVEARIRELPGMEWFDLFTRYVERHDIRRAPEAWLDQPGACSASAAE
jgi:hypothetical protein